MESDTEYLLRKTAEVKLKIGFSQSAAATPTDAAVKVKFSLSRKAVCIVAVPFLIQILLLIQYGTLVQRVERLAEQQYFSKAILNHGNWISMLLSIACNSLVAYSASKDGDYLTTFKSCLRALPKSYKETEQLIDPKSPQIKSLHEFKIAGEEVERKLNSLLPFAEEGDENQLSKLLSDSNAKVLWHKMFSSRHDLLAYERLASFNDPEALPAARLKQKVLLAVIFLVDLASALFVIYSFNAQIGRKLTALAKKASLMGARQPMSAPLGGSDEIGFLDRSLHQAAKELLEARQQLEDSERRLRQVIKNMPVGLLTLDSDFKVDTANDEMQRLFNLSENNLHGKSLSEFLPEFELEQDLRKGTIEIKEIQLLNEDDPLVIEVSSRNYSSSEGALTLIALHDITARRELERMRQDFLNMVSHDLRSPLTSIRLFLNLLARGAYGQMSESGFENLARAERNVDRLLNMINDLLDFEKMQAGQIVLEIEPLSVADLASAAADLMQGVAQKNDITIEVHPSRSVLLGDRERLVQVLANLLSNAIKFSPPGGTVSVQSEDLVKSVLVKVTDTGRGVPAEKIDIIFDKFKQADLADSKVKKGVGLGLPICKWIVEQHGGEIGVDSEFGQGSTFWFRLERATEVSLS